MSDFMVSIPAAGLMHRPPESNVMPLPTSASEALALAGFQASSTIRGGLADPWPTPTMPPNPPLARAFSSSTRIATFAGDSEARDFTESAKDCGKSRLGGVLTRSRA